MTLTADTNRTAAQNAMQTLIQVAKTRIAGSHRHNYVTASVPLNPSLDLPLTVDINVPDCTPWARCAPLHTSCRRKPGRLSPILAGYFFRCRRRRHALRHAEHCASRHQSGKHRAYRVSDCGFQLRSIGRPHDHRDLPRRGVGRAQQGQYCAVQQLQRWFARGHFDHHAMSTKNTQDPKGLVSTLDRLSAGVGVTTQKPGVLPAAQALPAIPDAHGKRGKRAPTN